MNKDKIIFLDRDGTINKEVEYLYRPEDLVLLPGVITALKELRALGFKLVVITNQAGVARGYYKESDVDKLHEHLNCLLKEKGAFIDRFFYCPHHPTHGTGPYRTECHCRKPDTGMFEMAEAFYQVDKLNSYMIGDKLIDTEAGRRYGVSTILVGTGYGAELKAGLLPGTEKEAFDYFAENMENAAEWIKNREGGR